MFFYKQSYALLKHLLEFNNGINNGYTFLGKRSKLGEPSFDLRNKPTQHWGCKVRGNNQKKNNFFIFLVFNDLATNDWNHEFEEENNVFLWFILLPTTPSPLLVAGPLQPTTKTPQKGLYRVVYILTFPHPHIHRSGLLLHCFSWGYWGFSFEEK